MTQIYVYVYLNPRTLKDLLITLKESHFKETGFQLKHSLSD